MSSIFAVFGMTKSGIEPTTYESLDGYFTNTIDLDQVDVIPGTVAPGYHC